MNNSQDIYIFILITTNVELQFVFQLKLILLQSYSSKNKISKEIYLNQIIYLINVNILII